MCNLDLITGQSIERRLDQFELVLLEALGGRLVDLGDLLLERIVGVSAPAFGDQDFDTKPTITQKV